jgi:uncharacterized protein DUF5134
VPTLLVAATLTALLPVLLWCVLRALGPADRHPGHRRDLYAWHVVLGLAMVAGVVGLPAPAAVLVATAAVVGLGWGLLSLDHRPTRGGYARLAVGAAAMVVMTVPLTLPSPAQASGHAAMGAMTAPGHGFWPALVPVTLAALAVAGATALVVAVRPGSAAVRRADACCDVVMAGVMAVMLAALL